jgi:uncharacterized protein with PQ loop repeat
MLTHGQLVAVLGTISTLCATVQYLPQLWMNYSRRSTAGFSPRSIIIKLVGASFQCANTYLMHQPLATFFYGFFNLVTHCAFLLQFSIYPGDNPEAPRPNYLLYCLFAIVPLLIGWVFPATLALTSAIKPLSQIFSHIPQLMLSIEKRSSVGVSVNSQWLNIVCGISGLWMLAILETPVAATTWMIYWNSLLQALSLFAVAVYYDGPRRLFTECASIRKHIPTL